MTSPYLQLSLRSEREARAELFRKPTDGMTASELRAHTDAMLAAIVRQCDEIVSECKVTENMLREALA
jgi:hypothetical protein